MQIKSLFKPEMMELSDAACQYASLWPLYWSQGL